MSETRAAIVTGTSAGVGEAVARELVTRGWTVIGIARRPSPVSGERYHHIACDLATVASGDTSLATQLARYGAVLEASRVGLVNNAAVPDGLMPLAKIGRASR